MQSKESPPSPYPLPPERDPNCAFECIGVHSQQFLKRRASKGTQLATSKMGHMSQNVRYKLLLHNDGSSQFFCFRPKMLIPGRTSSRDRTNRLRSPYRRSPGGKTQISKSAARTARDGLSAAS